MTIVDIEHQGDGWWGSSYDPLHGRILGPPDARTELSGERSRFYIVEFNQPLHDPKRGTGVAHRALLLAIDREEKGRPHFGVPVYPIDSAVPAERMSFSTTDLWTGAKVTVRFR